MSALFNFNLRNPFKTLVDNNFFETLYEKSGEIFGTKNYEVEATKADTPDIFDVSISATFSGRDHAGPSLRLELMGYSINLAIYDSRHWNYRKNCWMESRKEWEENINSVYPIDDIDKEELIELYESGYTSEEVIKMKSDEYEPEEVESFIVQKEDVKAVGLEFNPDLGNVVIHVQIKEEIKERYKDRDIRFIVDFTKSISENNYDPSINLLYYFNISFGKIPSGVANSQQDIDSIFYDGKLYNIIGLIS